MAAVGGRGNGRGEDRKRCGQDVSLGMEGRRGDGGNSYLLQRLEKVPGNCFYHVVRKGRCGLSTTPDLNLLPLFRVNTLLRCMMQLACPHRSRPKSSCPLGGQGAPTQLTLATQESFRATCADFGDPHCVSHLVLVNMLRKVVLLCSERIQSSLGSCGQP